MYVSPEELNEIMAAYDCASFSSDDHFQVSPDIWIYLFHDEEHKKYILVIADYMGDFDFDHYPHLLRFDDSSFHTADFVLQREIPAKNPASPTVSNSALFEYTD